SPASSAWSASRPRRKARSCPEAASPTSPPSSPPAPHPPANWPSSPARKRTTRSLAPPASWALARSVFSIPSDALHRTDPAGVAPAARAARRAGFRRFVLVGTAGSTPTGSFDDLEALARAARALRAWFHVDAAHGGGMAFSPRLRKLLRGLERADSVAFDPHKMMFMPLAAGCVLVRSGRRLRAAFEQDAPYLF